VATKATDPRPGPAKDRALEYVKAQILTGAFPGGELISEGERRHRAGHVTHPGARGIPAARG